MNQTQNKKQLECELRGPITWSDFFELKRKIEEYYGEFVATKELAIFIKGRHDIRIKIDHNGGRFVYKRRIGINDYKKEIEVKVASSEVLKLIEILSCTGFNNALFSYVEKYEAKKDSKSFSVKFGSKIGDFFEIETLLTQEHEIKNATTEMENYINKLGLNLWSDESYDALLKSSWKDSEEESMFDETNNTFNRVINDSMEKIFQKNNTFEKTIIAKKL